MIKCSFIITLIVMLSGCVASVQKAIYSEGDFTLSGSLCKPQGRGPFPAVVFNHGVLGQSSAVHRKRLVLRLRKRGLSDFLKSDVSTGRYSDIWMT